MENIVEKNKCTGCTACYSICPKNAIEMKEDENGFKYPVIDQNKCIDCGLCKKICPVLNKKSNIAINKCYVGYNKDSEIQEESSSGGVFDIIAKEVLKDNGLVVGAAFDENNKLKHFIVDNVEYLKKLRGSKYLQSDLNSVFKQIKENVKNRKILFVGVPCQVAGLKAFLNKDYDNLMCVDLICHGVPTPKLFDKYVKELEETNRDELINYNFRDKSTGWDSYSNTATFKNETIKELQSNNAYMKLFLSDVALRVSCYNCNFKLGNKYSDITLGDFWGVKNYYPEMYNKKGVSAIIINTKKGKEIIRNISSQLELKECKLEEIVKGNPSLTASSKKPEKRKEFFNELNNKVSFFKLAKDYSKHISFLKRLVNKSKRTIKVLFKIK